MLPNCFSNNFHFSLSWQTGCLHHRSTLVLFLTHIFSLLLQHQRKERERENCRHRNAYTIDEIIFFPLNAMPRKENKSLHLKRNSAAAAESIALITLNGNDFSIFHSI
jgi:hypothetical protein